MKVASLCVCFLLAIAFGVMSGGPLGYIQTNLVSDGAVTANTIDPDLKNPWGISFGPTTPFWIADNGTSLSTLYNGLGVKQGLVVSMPTTGGDPTGTVFNGTSANFMGDRFLFATESGTINGWQGGTSALIRASPPGAVFKGLAIDGDRIYATDFVNGIVDVFNSSYTEISVPGKFLDPSLPSGYAPFGIQDIGGKIYVAFAKQGGGIDEADGPGFGYVDVFDRDGNLLQRLVSGGALNAPWGLALAPVGFGDLGGLLLVGNFGDGMINAYDPGTGAFVDSLRDSAGNPIVIDGLWGLDFGNGGTGFSSNKLYFTAGLNDENDGLFGSLEAVPEPATVLLVAAGFGLIALFRKRATSQQS